MDAVAVTASGVEPEATPFACRMKAARLTCASSPSPPGSLGGIVRMASSRSSIVRGLQPSSNVEPVSGGAYGPPVRSAPWQKAQLA